MNGHLLLVYGEKEFMLIHYIEDLQDFKLLYRAFLSDWISAGAFLKDKGQFVLLTAHSVLLRFQCDSEGKCVVHERSSCADKSTLYCGYIEGDVWLELLIFGGNAFGELIIWQPSQASGDKAAVQQRLAAHNGVIFSIHYSPKARLLCTTSDDRSLRLWQVESGEGENDSPIGKLKPIASGFGHLARVFQCRILEYGSTTYVVTVGEDSYLCLWNPKGELLFKKRQQFGAVIWNFDYDPCSHNIYTVGSTGNLLRVNLREILADLEISLECLAPVNSEDGMEYITKIKFFSSELLVALTNFNRFIYKKEDENAWLEVTDFSKYKCTVLEVYKDIRVALCGYKRLTIYAYNLLEQKFDKHFDAEILPGVIRSLQFLDCETWLLSDELGNCAFVEYDAYNNVLTRREIELPKARERWITSALLIPKSQQLVLSNRQGSLLYYKFNITSDKFELKDSLRQLHGTLGCTVIQLDEVTESEVSIRTSGHDGSIKSLSINNCSHTLRVNTRHLVPVIWIESIFHHHGTTYYLGFNDNHFVVWSRSHDFVAQVPCGGGHRGWHFTRLHERAKDYLKVAFIRNRQVLTYRVDLKVFHDGSNPLEAPARNEWHTKCCNCLELIDGPLGNMVLASAGDDNLVKISLCENNHSLKQKAEISDHISNVRALKSVPVSNRVCLLITGGGRAQLCVNKLDLCDYSIRQMINYFIKPIRQDYKCHSFDPETRIMSLDVRQVEKGLYIYLGCSDGFLRQLHMSDEYEVTMCEEFAYGKCILQVKVIDKQPLLLIAATDGLISLYDLQLNELHVKVQQHSSGINALDTRVLGDDHKELQIITGGDDQNVAFSRLDLRNLAVLEQWSLPNMHTAQVTAVRFVPEGQYAYSSGVDQTIYKIDLDSKQFHLVAKTCVADIKGSCLSTKSRQILLHGCGLQIMQLRRDR